MSSNCSKRDFDESHIRVGFTYRTTHPTNIYEITNIGKDGIIEIKWIDCHFVDRRGRTTLGFLRNRLEEGYYSEHIFNKNRCIVCRRS